MDIGITRVRAPESRLITEVAKSGGQNFSQLLRHRMNDQQKQQLNKRILEILDELESSATRLLQEADLALYQRYCRRLGDVLNEILENAYLFKTESVLDSNGRKRVYASITVVDERLEKLGTQLLSGNSSRLAFISRIDEIRGIIMDLFS